jgi:hypothetical protein
MKIHHYIREAKMKKNQQWQKPDLSAMKERSSKKVIGSSRNGSMRYGTGVGPTPPAPYSTGVGPTPPARYSTGIGPTPTPSPV